MKGNNHNLNVNLILFSMGFFNETTNLFDNHDLQDNFKIECLGRRAIVISGYKKISKLEESEIEIKLKKEGKILIRGAKLYIKRLEEDEAVIAGNILEIVL